MDSIERHRIPRTVFTRLNLLLTVMVAGLPLGAAAQAITFADASEAAGLTTGAGGHGMAVHDYDGDGWDDVVVAVTGGATALFRNNHDGTFTNVAAEAGVAAQGTYDVALWGDVDNDGDPDLFLGQGTTGQSKLFLHNGDPGAGQTPTFTDVSEAVGIDLGANVATAAFSDYDGDGNLDLFMAIDRGQDRLYRNLGAAGPGQAPVFEDVSAVAGIAGDGFSVAMQAAWADYDHDGDPDLLCVHDSRVLSRLYKNSGSLPLVNVAPAAHIDTYPDLDTCCNMGIAWGDFDGDGWEDAYVTRIGKGGLFHNNGDGTFTDVAAERGAVRNGMSWGVVFADFDNDADQDLFVVSTSGYDGTPTLLYRNDDGAFTEVGAAAGASFKIEAQGLATGDFNNDGRPDLVIPTHSGKHKLLLNTTEAAGNWITLQLRSSDHNRMAVGARVEVVAGERVLVRTVSGGDSFASQSSPTLHFGLGEAALVDTVRIYWGGGAVQTMTGLSVNGNYAVAEVATATGLDGEAPPSAFRLDAAYPNPFGFGTSTTIGFALDAPGRVRLDVFDVLGRRVAVLLEGYRAAGEHRVPFEATGLPAGLYRYRLQVDGRVESRTMVLAK